MYSRRRAFIAACSVVSTLVMVTKAQAQEPQPAQGTSQPPAAAVPLPPLTVEASKEKKASSKKKAAKATSPAKSESKSADSKSTSNGETATGPVKGYVASQSATGTKTDTPLIETPQSVSVVTADQIKAQGAQGVAEALRYTSGVTSDYYGPSSMARDGFARSRGFFLDEYLDGLRLGHVSASTSYSWIEPYQLERIEVLKGPSSILYGQASPGGVLNMVSKRPQEKPFNEIQLQTGSFDRLQGAIDTTGALDQQGKLLYRFTGLIRDADTQVDHSENQRIALAPSLTWKPSADTSLTLLGKYQHDPNMLAFQFMPAAGTVLANPNGKISTKTFTGQPAFDDSELTQQQLGYVFEHRFDQVWKVRQNFRYIHSDEIDKYVFGIGLQADQRTLNRFAFLYDADFDMYTVDSQAEARFATGALQHTMLFGIDYRNSDEDFSRGTGLAPTLDIFDPDYGVTVTSPILSTHVDQTQRQVGLYAQEQLKLDRWVFLIGGRQDWAEGETDTTNLLTSANTKAEQKDDAFTWRTGAVYLFDNGLAPYASYSESFQPTNGTGFNGTLFDPTTGQQYELGVKYQPKGFNSFVTLSAFDLTQQNVLTTDPDPTHLCGSLRCSVQTGEVRSRGFEVEGKASLTEGLSVTAAYSYLDSEVTKSNSTDLGKVPTRTPAHQASIWGDYTVQSGAFAGIGIGAGVRFVGSSYGDAINTLKVPDYSLVDAALHYDFDSYRLQVNAANLFDEEYVASCTGYTSCYFGYRRNVTATLTYRW